MGSRLVIRTRAESDDLAKAAMSIEQAAWSELGYLSYTRPHYELYANLLEEYPEYQLCLVDEQTGYPVAVFNSVPLCYKGDGDLPQEGWDWVVETGASPKGPHNVLGGLAMSIPAVHRAKGYGRKMLQAMRELAQSKGLHTVLAAVRPSSKSAHPWVGIDDYITWRDDRGQAFDPWLRSHLNSGGKLVGPCRRSMVVDEPVAFWETWSRQTFDRSGFYALDGALVPLDIDLDHDIGRYEEPNVWVTYAC